MKTIAAALVAAFLFATPTPALECRPLEKFEAVWLATGGQISAPRPVPDNDAGSRAEILSRGIFVGDYDAVSPAVDVGNDPWLAFSKDGCFIVAVRLFGVESA